MNGLIRFSRQGRQNVVDGPRWRKTLTRWSLVEHSLQEGRYGFVRANRGAVRKAGMNCRNG